MTDHEIIDIVDEFDNILGQDTKQNKFDRNLISRNVAIFLADSDNNIIIAKRSPKKKVFPDKFDLSACGNVMADESYEDAALRELKEELGIECELSFLSKVYNELDGKLRFFTAIFLGRYDGNISLNDELTEFHRLKMSDIESRLKHCKDDFCPFFINDFEKVKHLLPRN